MSGTLIVAILGLISGGLALAWQITAQIVDWARGRPNVKVSSTYTTVFEGDPPEQMDYLRVTAKNIGGAPTAVEMWGIETRSGGVIRFPDFDAPSAPLPSRLEPHSSASWYLSAHSHKYFCDVNEIDEDELRAWVRLMSGEVVYDEEYGVPSDSDQGFRAPRRSLRDWLRRR